MIGDWHGVKLLRDPKVTIYMLESFPSAELSHNSRGGGGGGGAISSAWKNVGMTMTCNGSDVAVIQMLIPSENCLKNRQFSEGIKTYRKKSSARKGLGYAAR